MTKEIKLTGGKVAIVDDLWYEELNQYKWYAARSRGGAYYARRNELDHTTNKIQIVSMHRVIMNTPKGMHTDHINHDTLDNREENLRVCTPSQNKCNSKKQTNNTSGYKGVNKRGNKWIARIRVENDRIYLGRFQTPEEAYRAYVSASKRLHGEYANLGVVGYDVQ